MENTLGSEARHIVRIGETRDGRAVLLRAIILVWTLMFGSGAAVFAFSGAGDGLTTTTPYVITTVDQLQEMSNDLSAHYALGNDIVADATRSWNGDLGFEPVGTVGFEFTGTLDGRGYTISGLFIDRTTDCVGLFGCVSGPSSFIRDVGIEDADIGGQHHVGGLIGLNSNATVSECYATGRVSGTGTRIGGLIGYNSGSSATVSECYATGSVSGRGDYGNYIGGLIGRNYQGAVIQCHATGNVSGTGETGERVGGLIGMNHEGAVSQCYATGSVSGPKYVGGLIGYNGGSGATLSDCYAEGNVSGTRERVGGLIGWNADGALTRCYATGRVSGMGERVGGLVGYNEGLVGTRVSKCYATGSVSGMGERVGGLIGWNIGAVLSECYATGSVSGTGSNSDCIGGLIGHNSGLAATVSRCYAKGSVSGSTEVGGLIGSNAGATVAQSYAMGLVAGSTSVGGLIGSSADTANSCFWDTETTSQTASAGGAGAVGKTTLGMRQQATFDPPWDFATVWTIVEADTSPFFLWQDSPTDVQATDGTSTQTIEVVWHPAAGATHYQVYRCASRDGTRETMGAWQTATAFSDALTSPSTTYHYWVRAAAGAAGEEASDLSDSDYGWRRAAADSGPAHFSLVQRIRVEADSESSVYTWNFDTEEADGMGPVAVDHSTTYGLFYGDWVGVYLYDFDAVAWTEAVYSYREDW